MRNNDRFEVYEAALEKWGVEAQLFMLFEEIGELQQAISKHHREGSLDTKNRIIEEVADVEIMLEQLRLVAHIPIGEVEAVKAEKIGKLRKILEVNNK